MQKYISIDSSTNDVSNEVHFTNKENQFIGKFCTTDGDGSDEVKDIKDLFVTKGKLSGVEKIDPANCTVSTIVNKINELIDMLKN